MSASQRKLAYGFMFVLSACLLALAQSGLLSMNVAAMVAMAAQVVSMFMKHVGEQDLSAPGATK